MRWAVPMRPTRRLLAADANTRIYFQPNADYNGTLATAITFRAWDQSSGRQRGHGGHDQQRGHQRLLQRQRHGQPDRQPGQRRPQHHQRGHGEPDRHRRGHRLERDHGRRDSHRRELGRYGQRSAQGHCGHRGERQRHLAVLHRWDHLDRLRERVGQRCACCWTRRSQVRYVPDGQNGETATFSFRAWDQTTGTASTNGSPSTANPGAGGGSSAYSSEECQRLDRGERGQRCAQHRRHRGRSDGQRHRHDQPVCGCDHRRCGQPGADPECLGHAGRCGQGCLHARSTASPMPVAGSTPSAARPRRRPLRSRGWCSIRPTTVSRRAAPRPRPSPSASMTEWPHR